LIANDKIKNSELETYGLWRFILGNGKILEYFCEEGQDSLAIINISAHFSENYFFTKNCIMKLKTIGV
jgi:hypothetical protein